jgi:DMSO/TMAO reductase YedYZ molybdopterin-dependent catalytic subunit
MGGQSAFFGMVRGAADLVGKAELTRRELLRGSLSAAGCLLVGLDKIRSLPARENSGDPFPRGHQLGVVDFVGEGQLPVDTPVGNELDGRLFTDLSTLTPEHPITPIEKFYVRTRASELLGNRRPWLIQLGGLSDKQHNVPVEDLERIAKPTGLHLMECVGNVRGAHFGMVSVADWAGVPLFEILHMVRMKPQASYVLISGFDVYSATSTSSIPGASWIFPLEQLVSSNAFLATTMNSRPLTKDHGAPVRLVVPGCYGCTCIKWVNEITLLDDTVEATSQMREYATRTQSGLPSLAKEYRPALIDLAAMPLRVEQWLVEGRIKYRVVGIVWGGSRPVNALEIRFGTGDNFAPVDGFQQIADDSWSFWTHEWIPKTTGTYTIYLRVKNPSVPTTRLDSGRYLRSVEITQV